MGKKTTNTNNDAPIKRAATPAPKAKHTVDRILAPAANVEKPAASTAPRKRAAKKPAPEPGFTRDDLALRAYFLCEKRWAAGLPGDEASDWLEAERQLLAEHSGLKSD